MRNIALAALAIAVLGFGGLFALRSLPQEEQPELRLRAVLAEPDRDVTDKVTWFVERDDAWLGPDIGTTLVAVPGTYTAEFQVLGDAAVTAETTVDEGNGGELFAQLDASLVEIKLDEATGSVPVTLQFESKITAGSESLQLFEDGYVRALVSRDLRKLELVLPNQSFPITADFAAGTVMTFELADGAITPVN